MASAELQSMLDDLRTRAEMMRRDAHRSARWENVVTGEKFDPAEAGAYASNCGAMEVTLKFAAKAIDDLLNYKLRPTDVDVVQKLIAERDGLRAELKWLIGMLKLIESAKARGFGIDHAQGIASDALARVQGRFDTPSGHDVGCVEHPPGFAQTCSCGARAQGGAA